MAEKDDSYAVGDADTIGGKFTRWAQKTLTGSRSKSESNPSPSPTSDDQDSIANMVNRAGRRGMAEKLYNAQKK